MSTLLARVGIGALTIDTVLEDLRVTPGGTLRGTVLLEGGDVRQTVERITLSLTTNFRRGGQPEPVLLGRMRLGEGITVRPGETRTLGFAMPVPPTTPVTMGEQHVTLRTRASIARSVDQVDQDVLIVQPHPLLRRTFDELRGIGLLPRGVNQLRNRRVDWGTPYVQSFAFRPTSEAQWPFRQLELIGFLGPDHLELWFELDRETAELTLPEEDGPFAGRQVRLTVTQADLGRADLGQRLAEALRVAPSARAW